MTTKVHYNKPAIKLISGVEITKGNTYVLRATGNDTSHIGNLYICVNHHMVNLTTGQERDTCHKELWEEVDLEINVVLR